MEVVGCGVGVGTLWCGLGGGGGRGTCDESRVKQPITLITECHSCSRWSTACGLRGCKVGARARQRVQGRCKGRSAWHVLSRGLEARSVGPPQASRPHSCHGEARLQPDKGGARPPSLGVNVITSGLAGRRGGRWRVAPGRGQ